MPSRISQARMRGLTLVELLVVIAIAAVLAVIAVPSLRSTLQTNQLDTVSNQLVAALATARSEAVRAPDLTVQVANPSAATPKQWSNGWATTAQPLAGPQLNLQAPLPVPGQLSVNSNWPGPIGFDAMGRLVLANPPPLIFVICLDPAQPTVNQSRAVIVSASGRASIAHIGKAGANQGIPVDDTNAPILTCSP